MNDETPTLSLRLLVRNILLSEPGVDHKMAGELSALFLCAFSRWLAAEAVREAPDRSGTPPRSNGRTAFDPFSFGAVAVLIREGRPALQHRLSQIESIDDLRLLASAQRLSLPAGLEDAGQLREAIATSAERRLVGRLRAARV